MSSETYTCSCRDGYWGLACQHDCPGGPQTPCSNHGHCNKTTGKCLCDPNWRGNINCTTCSPGWHGLDCSIVVQSPNNHTAAAFGHGYFITLDGTGYNFLGNGEYYLILSQSFVIQGRMVTCFSSSSCFNAVAVRIAQYTLLVHSRFSNREEPVVFANGKRTYSLEFDFGPANQKFTFKRTSRLQFALSTTYGVQLIIRLYDRYLDIHLRVDNQTYCQTSQGLWGNCNFNSYDDLSSRDGELVTALNASQLYIHEVYGESWKVKEEDSLFVYDINNYHEKRLLYGGGYALYFNNSGAHTGEIYSFTSSDITIEFMVHAESENGTLLSYTSTKMFAVVLDSGKIKLRYEDTILDTLAVIQQQKWNHIALVWSVTTRILQFYHRDDTGLAHSRNFPITSSVNVFQPGGILALGYCQPAPGGLKIPLKEGFIGQIDEVRIWNQKLDPFTISANWRSNLGCTTRIQNLASLWKFNEGDGTVAYDCVSSAHITFQSGIWQGPMWVYSTVDIPQFSADIVTAYSFRFGSTWMSVEQTCYDLIFGSSLSSQYTTLNTATLWFYHMSCVTSVTRSSQYDNAYWPLMALSDFHQLFAEHSSWYAQSLCSHVSVVNFPEWYGLNCAKRCKFGLPRNTSDDSCVCMKGFYGVNCSGECPGGYHVPCTAQSPCNNNTGKCNCPVTANITHDCSVCTPGWIGPDCSVALGGNESNPDNFTCQGFGAAHYTTFDGAGYSFGTYGEFYLIKTNQFRAQVRQIPCMSGSFCISSVAMKTGSTEITIRASYNGSGMPLVWFNRILTDTTSLTLENNFSFRKISPQAYEISNDNPGKILLRVKAWQKYLSFEITSSPQWCTVASGLCSSCDSNIANDFTNTTGAVYWGHTISQRTILEIFGSQWQVFIIDSLFIFGYTSYNEQQEITANGYALNFNGTFASTSPLNTAFVKGKDFTLQLFVKVHASGGTIISYAKGFTFAIVNDVSIKVYVGGTAYDMGVTLPIGTWIQVSVAYSSSTGKSGLVKYTVKFRSQGVLGGLINEAGLHQDVFFVSR